jgi:preprotein translocase subunit YajC
MQQFILLTSSSSGGGGGSPIMQFIPLILIVVVIYFFMIRPQQKRAKEQKEFRENVQKGDKIVTIGGIHAKVVEVKDNELVIDPGNNYKLTVDRSAISMESSKEVQQQDSETS